MSPDLRERLAALADRLESVRTPPARSDPTMASEYWRGYRAARDECVACLRALLDETAEGQPECCIRYEFQNALARPVCEAHGELTGGYFKLELAAKIGDEHLTAQPAAEAAQDGPTIEDVLAEHFSPAACVEEGHFAPDVPLVAAYCAHVAQTLRQAGVAR